LRNQDALRFAVDLKLIDFPRRRFPIREIK